MLDFRISQLRSFLTLAETLNYARAARLLYMAQPTLSAQILALEEAFEVRVFERNRKQVKLTPAGEKLRSAAQTMLHNMEQLSREMQQTTNAAAVRVCSSQSGQFSFLPSLMHLLPKREPSLRLEFLSILPQSRREFLLRNRVDVLLMVPPIHHEGLAYRTVYEESLMAAVPEREPYLSMQSISLAEFAVETVLLPTSYECASCKKRSMEIFEQYQVTPVTMEAPIEQNARMALIASGNFVGFIGDSARNAGFPGVRILPFRERLPLQPLGIAWRTDDTSVALLRLLRVADELEDSARRIPVVSFTGRSSPFLGVPNGAIAIPASSIAS